ncbi:Fibrinogen-like protein A [Holothuria leucospilota]|uniref:Fibrinogen-like protein A n=1 Tax=Holothuria leucospilota TaxID=206669 RepID=A0A9Q1BF98_HOLLE|nr:Fibrinogen-like protein A [Holothuria leucospilota]
MLSQERVFTIHHLLLITLWIRCSLSSLVDNEEVKRGDRTKRSFKGVSFFNQQQPDYPRDCQEVYDRFDGPPDGVFVIKPDGYLDPFEVYCDNTFDSGGWTVFQRRMDGGVKFYRNWNDYKNGFGFLHRDFWLGNEKLSYLTNQKDYELRIDLINTSGSSSYARYDLFRISDEGTLYKLIGLGSYEGNIGSVSGRDYMETHRGQHFTTFDQDNDNTNSRDCGREMHGGWWYDHCYYSNFNGEYEPQDKTGICLWDHVYGIQCGIKFTEMKIRPI